MWVWVNVVGRKKVLQENKNYKIKSQKVIKNLRVHTSPIPLPRGQSYNPRRPPLGTFENQDTRDGKTRYI